MGAVLAGDLTLSEVGYEVTEVDSVALNGAVGERRVAVWDGQRDHAAVRQNGARHFSVARVEALAGQDHPHDRCFRQLVSPVSQLVGRAWMPAPCAST